VARRHGGARGDVGGQDAPRRRSDFVVVALVQTAARGFALFLYYSLALLLPSYGAVHFRRIDEILNYYL
jgi:hypothetical protein